MDIVKWICVTVGFVSVFLGAAYRSAESKRSNGVALTDFQLFLFGTGFTYTLTVFCSLLTFAFDYFLPGSALQGYNLTPEKNVLFFALFGRGQAGEAQYPVMHMDLCFLGCLFGCALGGAALLVWRAAQNRKRRTPQNGLLYGFAFPKTGVRAYFRNEAQTLKAQLHPLEYVCWWALRAGMAYFFVKRYLAEGFDYVCLQLCVNLIATFIIPLVRVLFFGKLFFGNINYRVQSFLDIFIFSGSLLGQGLGWNCEVPEFDKFLHFMSGGVAVVIGCLLIEGTRGGRLLSRHTKTAASVGFSCTVMVVWELFEFFADFYIPDTCNQNFTYAPPADMFFFRWFGLGAQNPGQAAVLDTNIDIFLAFCGCMLAAGGLFAVLTLRERSSANRSAGKNLLHAYNYTK